MKLKSFVGLLLIAILAIGSIDTASAQREKKNRRKKDKTENIKSPNNLRKSMESPTYEELSKMDREMADSIKRALDTETFDNAILPFYMSCRHILDNGSVLVKGDSTRIKFLINPRKIIRFEAFGYGEASPEDIKKGEWIITVRPEKTMHLKFRITLVNGSSTMSGQFFVVVDNPNEIKAEYKQLPREKRTAYIKKLVGEEFYDKCMNECKEYNRVNFKPFSTSSNNIPLSW
jgi:hypothetical protein